MRQAPAFSIVAGFPSQHRAKAALLFWDAFRDKLHPIMKPECKALEFLEYAIDASHAVSAVSPDGDLLGIAGFKTNQGTFVGGNLLDLQSVYGHFGGVWRGFALSVLERPLEAETLLMDGIMVTETARGQGIGAALLSALKDKAVELHCTKLRLDVIDTNPRARALYERQGFVENETSDMGPLQHVFGFRQVTTMTCQL